MRSILMCMAACALCAGEAPLPTTSQKLIDDSIAASGKLRDGYRQALGKEQAKLVAALQKEQERFTKKGDLDAALAVKAAIEQVQAGLLEKKVDESKDLLGDGPQAAGGMASTFDLPPAGLATSCPIAPTGAGGGEVPTQLAAFMTHAVRLVIPKGDPARYPFQCRQAGLVVVSTGPSERHHAELWKQLGQAGFKRLDSEDRGAWFVLEATPAAQFTLADVPSAGMEVTLYAGQIRQQR